MCCCSTASMCNPAPKCNSRMPDTAKTGGEHNVPFPALLTRALLILVFPPETSLRVRTASQGLHAVWQKLSSWLLSHKSTGVAIWKWLKTQQHFLLNTKLQSCPFQSGNSCTRTAWSRSGQKKGIKKKIKWNREQCPVSRMPLFMQLETWGP